MSGWRHPTCGDVDRSRPLSFTFDGQPLSGFEGDTLASALLASGPRILGRSFKYHRPRGLWGMGGEEPNAILDVTGPEGFTPNVRATQMRLQEGMVLRSVNAAPDAARDRFGIMALAHRFLPAGFYYKTFMALGWMRWEPMIRRMAGLGRVDPGHHPAADAVPMNADRPRINVGRPDQLTVTINGSQVAPLGDGSRAIKDVGISAEALRGRGGAPTATVS